MLSEKSRKLLFTGVCIPIRLLIPLLLTKIPMKYRKYIGLLFLIPVIGWIKLTFYPRSHGAFGPIVWWRPFRIWHILLYLAFVGFNWLEYPNAYLFLILDAVLGLIFFSQSYYFK